MSDATIYLSERVSTAFRLPYENDKARTRVAKSAIMRELQAHHAYDEHHRQLLEALPGDPTLKLEGTGYGWWKIQAPASSVA